MTKLSVSLQEAYLKIGQSIIFNHLSFSLNSHDKACLVGRNGTGKSTLLRVLAGIQELESGIKTIQKGCKVSYLPQEPCFDTKETVLNYVMKGLPPEHAFDTHLALNYLDQLSIDPDRVVTTLSGGESRRADLARALASKPDLLLLDEPTNHLDLPTIQWLEKTLQSFAGSILLISHDRYFLEAVTSKVLWLDRGQLKILSKSFKYFEEWSETILEQEEKERHKLERKIHHETIWSHQGITARRKRNQGRLRALYGLREERAQYIDTTQKVSFATQYPPGSGDMIIEAINVSKTYHDRPILSPFSLRILRKDRIGILGPNGAGKTTLIQILTGNLPPDQGHVNFGTRLLPVYLDQKRESLSADKTIFQILCPQGGENIYVQGAQRHVTSYMKDFLFLPEQLHTPVRVLSGGERNRLLLAVAFSKPSNLMILDEPTNDLDMETLDLLEEALNEYQGTLIVVSHDRAFLDKVVTATIALEGDGVLKLYAGGYSDYIQQRAREHEEIKTVKKEKYKEAGSSASPKKLSYNQVRRLNALPQEIESLSEAIKTLESQLQSPELYEKDQKRLQELTTKLADHMKKKETLEHEWLELEMLQEEYAQR